MISKYSQKNIIILIIVFVLNCVLILGIIISIIISSYINAQKSWQQNINDITNISSSVSSLSEKVFDNYSISLKNIQNYLQNRDATFDEAVDVIFNLNTEAETQYHIVGTDLIGKACVFSEAAATYVNYSGYTAQADILASATLEDNGKISFLPVFTNPVNGLLSVSFGVYVNLYDGGVLKPYTILSVVKSAFLDELINNDTAYDELYCAVVDMDGDYILTDGEYYKLNNIFSYFKTYNNLTVAEESAIKSAVYSKNSSVYELKNDLNENCVFVFSKLPGSDWLCVICVPVNTFFDSYAGTLFTLITSTILLGLLAFDLIYMYPSIKQLRISNEYANHANRAKTEFLSRMSHDMRTPMNGIINMSQFISESKSINEIKEYNKNILESSNYLLMLINDTLDMNRIELGKIILTYEPTNTAALVQEIIDEIKPSADAKNVTLTYSARRIINGTYMFDKLRLRQLISNLISNAVKFTPAGGKVEIIVEHLKREDDILSYRFIVRDTGIGMSPEFVKKMYEPFEQERSAVGEKYLGSGLGLSIVKKKVNLMGGEISCKSELGVGTEFTLNFTCKIVTETASPKKEIDVNDIDLNGKRVLVVEDNYINTVVAVKMLATKGVIVDTAKDGKQALDAFDRSEEGYYDAILMDLRMPVMDGLTATAQIRNGTRSDSKTVPIIAMTANAFVEDSVKSHEAGMNAHISKPVEADKLYITLYRLISDNEQ